MKRENCPLSLPEGYTLHKEIDLKKDTKLALKLNIWALIACVPLFAIGWLIQSPIEWFFDIMACGCLLPYALVLLLGSVAYIFLHELVHGIAIRHFCGQKANYGFTGIFAYAGHKTACFTRRAYVIIALAPVVLWGAVLLALNLLLPLSWFWPIYFIQISNLTGAVGDFYVCHLLRRIKGDLLVNDDGLSMRFYTKENN
ncbi:MAG: DUF3267 domain-containing protein [Christensenellaceae bacterium]|nr:DUF3267 domain-containing protein [Christensenellaceae bacterium]